MMRLRPFAAAFLATLLLAGLAAVPPGRASAQTGERCFPETGFCISGLIRSFWEQNGGLPVFGLPLGPQQPYTGPEGRTVQAQWFERHRIELHPDNPAPYDVLLGRLGVDRLAQQGRDWQSFPPFDPNDADAENCAFFAQTNRQVCGDFLKAFRSYGLSFPGRPGITFDESLALFGLPISEPMTETIEGRSYTVQWFERARFEAHPENRPPYNVLFGRLGAELSAGESIMSPLEGKFWQLVSFGPTASPEAAYGERPATLSFDGQRVGGNTGCNSFGGPYTATDGAITVGPVISTLAACSSETLNRQERAIFTALQGEVPFRLAGGELRLSYDGGRQTLTYAEASVTGTVRYLQRSALPPQAVIQVQLVDVSRADAPAIVIASTTFQSNGRQVPFPFVLPYDPAQIDQRFTYAVQARITIDDQLRFITTRLYPVITRGNPTIVDLIVDPV